MKANKIISINDYNEMILKPNEIKSFQTCKNYYYTFGIYGASIRYLKSNLVKNVGDWRKYNYEELCKQFDSLKFDL